MSVRKKSTATTRLDLQGSISRELRLPFLLAKYIFLENIKTSLYVFSAVGFRREITGNSVPDYNVQ